MGYFDKEKEQKGKNKIYLFIIISLMIVNLIAFKAILSIASNKTIVIQVPQFLESGKYVIGNTFANDNVYKMWGKIWIEEIANFSYKNVRKRSEDIFPYLDPQTAFENKSKIMKFVTFVENNFVTQKFIVQDIFIEDLPNGYKRIKAEGTIKRKIGKKQDKLDGFPYAYELITFVRNGQIYINSIKAFISDPASPINKKRLNSINSVNYHEMVEDASINRKDPRALRRERIRKQQEELKKKRKEELEKRKARIQKLKEEGEM